MNKKRFWIILCVSSVLVMITYTALQLLGNWRGNIAIYIVGIIVIILSSAEMVKDKRVENMLQLLGIIISCLVALLFIGGCIFLYLFNKS